MVSRSLNFDVIFTCDNSSPLHIRSNPHLQREEESALRRDWFFSVSSIDLDRIDRTAVYHETNYAQSSPIVARSLIANLRPACVISQPEAFSRCHYVALSPLRGFTLRRCANNFLSRRSIFSHTFPARWTRARRDLQSAPYPRRQV